MAGFNLQSPRKLGHFSHHHILELSIWKGGAASEQLYCRGCIKPVENGLVYSCKVCNFDLHLSCAEIPQQISHPADSHDLNLLSRPWVYPSGACACDACGQVMKDGFSFHCSLCQLDLHPSCANLPMEFNHQHHPEHTLLLYFTPPYEDKSFTSCVCNKRSRNLWHFHCPECLYDVHVTCTHSLREHLTNQFPENYTDEIKQLVESLQELNQSLNPYTQRLWAGHMPIGNPSYLGRRYSEPHIYSLLTRPSMFNSSSSFPVQQQQRPPFPSAYANMNYNMFRRPNMELVRQSLSGGASSNIDFMSMMSPGGGGGGGDGLGIFGNPSSSEDLSSILNMISPGGGGGGLDIFGSLSGSGGFSSIIGSMFGFGFF